METRNITQEIEFRSIEGEESAEKETIIGYALKFDEPSEVLATEDGYCYRESISPDALKDCDLSNVTALFNHDENLIVGRTGVNLSIEIDEIGLKFTVTQIETSTYKDLAENVRAGLINQCSFAFLVDGDEWTKSTDEGIDLDRRIKSIKRIFDVSLVTTPAYPSTEAGVSSRAKKAIDNIKAREKIKQQILNRLTNE